MFSHSLFSSGSPCSRTQGTPCPGDRFPVYSAILGQKEEISMENTSLSLPLLSSLTLPQGSTNSPPPQADRICQLAHLLMCERAETGHPSSTTTAVRMRASVQTYVYVSQIYHVVRH